MQYLRLLCEHNDHAYDATFPGRNGLTDTGYWVPCDSHMGPLVYCGQHLRVHDAGWCTVSTQDKVPMRSSTLEGAYEEARKMGLPLYDPTSSNF